MKSHHCGLPPTPLLLPSKLWKKYSLAWQCSDISGIFHGVEWWIHYRLKTLCSFSPCCFICLFCPPSLYLCLNQCDSFSPLNLSPLPLITHPFCLSSPSQSSSATWGSRKQSYDCHKSSQRWAGIITDSRGYLNFYRQQNQIIDFMCE